MSLTYTTKEAISNRLRGRLTVGGPQVPFAPTTVDDNLIVQVGEQVESRVNAQLKTVYKLPLKTPTNPILASIVEKGVICELMGTHYVGQEANPQDGYGRMMCKQFQAELAEVVTGAIALDGEVPATGSPELEIGNLTVAGTRKPIVNKNRMDAGTVKW
jgi:hypothetical protein